MTRQQWLMIGVAFTVGAAGAQASAQTPLFVENFDGLTLRESVNERAGFPIVTAPADDTDSTPIANAFSATGPAGWNVDNTLGTFGGVSTVGNAGVPTGGVVEWEGWNFANKDFWVEAAGDQERGLFTFGAGTVAVVDPDEYYDLGDGLGPGDLGFYNSSLSTPSIGLGTLGVGVGQSVGVNLAFDSSYRVESFDDTHPNPAFTDLNNQSAEIIAVFDTGETQTIPFFDSSVGADSTNEAVAVNVFPNDFNATSVQFFFNLGNAGNDWWWAVDNIEVSDIDSQTGLPVATPAFTEDFEGVALGDSVNERRSLVASKVTAANDDPDTVPVADAFTNEAPAGWTIDNSNTPAATLGNNNVGSYELEGWNFLDKDFWNFVDQGGREEFDNASGVIAVADGDEWDDLGDPTDFGELNTLLETPAIDLTGRQDGEDTLLVEFDASWRDEDSQTAVVVAEFSDGTIVELLRWESDPNSENFFDDNPNVAVALATAIPDGADDFTLSFQYIGTNDWWFAIDNVRVSAVTAVPEPNSIAMLGMAAAGLGRRRRR